MPADPTGSHPADDQDLSDGPRLRRGDLPPRMVTPPPGPRSRSFADQLEAHEAPGVNTLASGPQGPVPSVVWTEALGVNVLDADGNRYLDLTSGFGVAAVGHRHPRVVAAVERQARRLLHGLGDVHAHPLRAELASRLARLAPVGGTQGRDPEPLVHFGISGAEAAEIALKTALLATGKPGVVAFDPAYHGLTLGALAATSRPAFREPFAPWLGIPVHRLPWGGEAGELAQLLAGRDDVGALIFEPVMGREGTRFPPAGWLAEIAAIARRHGVLVISDEIYVGFGRTGRWFGVDHDAVRPDLLVCGKALGGGVPLAAVVGRRALMTRWASPGEAIHTATFVAHPLACAAGLACLDILEGEDLPGRARRLEPFIAERLEPLAERPGVAEVRGRGFLWAVETHSPATARAVAAALRARGVLVLAGGAEGRVVQIAPPLSIPRSLLDLACRQLGEAIAETTSRE